ncbi:hypothetical protein [Maledivibacter halophilus]|uniref:Uncharacterized protein n=1 Tax=Maledivibacter halophilus TaxID=36842 RepID=A0A1T5M3R2_9FIRM|nr:hypothetical protein [Maledivibacter halophilus]SKC82872.1 hypothetical protein SAMN02194393_03767 [Maledivibacter halophilus]
MPDYTTNINLEKPLANEYFNIDIQNRNMDIIDTEIVKKASSTQDGRMSKEDKEKLDGIQEGAIDSLAGEGRTTETVKKNADDISNLDLKMFELTSQGGIAKVKIQSTEINNEDGEPNGTLVIYIGE